MLSHHLTRLCLLSPYLPHTGALLHTQLSMRVPVSRRWTVRGLSPGRVSTYACCSKCDTNLRPATTPRDAPWSPAALLTDLRSVNKYPIPSPTVLFATPGHLNALATAVVEEASNSSFLYSLAWRHKYASLLEGFLTRQSLWDRLVFDAARAKVFGKAAGTVRAAVSAGGASVPLLGESANTHLTPGPIELPSLAPMRIALSVPIVNAHTHPAVAGPVFASHPLDLQTFPVNDSEEKASGPAADAFAFTYLAAVGPPSVNIEAKLLGVNDADIEAGGDPVGTLHIRGPSVGKPAHRVDVREEDRETEGDGWVAAGQRARVLPNGTFKVVSIALK